MKLDEMIQVIVASHLFEELHEARHYTTVDIVRIQINVGTYSLKLYSIYIQFIQENKRFFSFSDL